ncbi:MAG: hypothetical protein ABIG11_01180 [bacterium]
MLKKLLLVLFAVSFAVAHTSYAFSYVPAFKAASSVMPDSGGDYPDDTGGGPVGGGPDDTDDGSGSGGGGDSGPDGDGGYGGI